MLFRSMFGSAKSRHDAIARRAGQDYDHQSSSVRPGPALIEPLEGRRHMDSTLLGYLGQSHVALVNVTMISTGETTITLTAIQSPTGKLVVPRPFIPQEPVIPQRPTVPGLFIALIPGNPL